MSVYIKDTVSYTNKLYGVIRKSVGLTIDVYSRVRESKMVIIVMGVSGSGKTTTGKLLADKLGWPFYDADDFHPPANVEKMRSGIPLTDRDRSPWLDALANLIDRSLANNNSIILACSALKARYRERLKAPARLEAKDVQFVYLKIPPSVAADRLDNRRSHFMPATLVQSQFETLEEPRDAIVINATYEPDHIVAEIQKSL